MNINELIPHILTFIAGGGLVGIFTIGAKKKKADVEVKVDEIEAIHKTVEMVYQPLINQQNTRIHELEQEVKQLRDQLAREREDHQREMDVMNKRILAITSALGIKASTQIRDEKTGRYIKKEEDES